MELGPIWPAAGSLAVRKQGYRVATSHYMFVGWLRTPLPNRKDRGAQISWLETHFCSNVNVNEKGCADACWIIMFGDVWGVKSGLSIAKVVTAHVWRHSELRQSSTSLAYHNASQLLRAEHNYSHVIVKCSIVDRFSNFLYCPCSYHRANYTTTNHNYLIQNGVLYH